MAMPGENRIEIPLLMEIQKAGGRAEPSKLYPAVAAHFPALTRQDLTRKLSSGAKAWWNRVQWTRQRLVAKGELDPSVHGVWIITEAGRARLRQAPEPKRRHVKRAARKGEQPAKRVDHDGLARAIQKIGQAFGFQTKWKPKVNDLRPPGARIKSKRKTLDVGWQIAGLAWVPIEVQVGGSVPDLMYPLGASSQGPTGSEPTSSEKPVSNPNQGVVLRYPLKWWSP